MKPAAALRRLWGAFRGSILFMPTWMTAGAFLLFGATSFFDERYADGITDAVDAAPAALRYLVFAGAADTATRLLAAIVGTWATIVGVVYSVTLVTIQLSATKYSAQVIPVFERDRLNQFVLGCFTGTFAYALLVLKTVRPQADDPFLPVVGVNVAVLLALVSLFLLIAFIGNLTAYIRPTRFVEDYASDGARTLHRYDDPGRDEGYEPAEVPPPRPREDACEIVAEEPGYVRRIEWARLREVLATHDVGGRLDVPVAQGMRVFAGDPLLRFSSRDRARVEAALKGVVKVEPVVDITDPAHIFDALGDVGVTAMAGGATDVGVAKAALDALLTMTTAALERPTVHPALRLRAGGREVLIVRQQEEHHLGGFRALKRILDKMAREGYWDVAEAFTLRSRILFLAAARDADDWRDTVRWFRPVARLLFAFDEAPVLLRFARNMAGVIVLLREGGHDGAAAELESILLDAARERGVEAMAREGLTGG